MKTCACCRVEIPDSDDLCESCASELVAAPLSQKPVPDAGKEPGAPGEFFQEAKPLDISSLDMGYSIAEGFSHPDWRQIYKGIKGAFLEGDWPQAWRQTSRQWIAQLRDDLGGKYRYYESRSLMLLSAEPGSDSLKMLKAAEGVIKYLGTRLGSANIDARQKIYGKRAILVFSDKDDYYSYVSYFYPEGEHAGSMGMFIFKGYGHIAIPFASMGQFEGVLVHESTHNCLMGLHPPIWLNEGVCQRMERELDLQERRYPGVIVTSETAREHREWWNEQNIQEFWAGTSFYRPGKDNGLSYALGQILVELLSESWGDFLDFVINASVQDAGQDAALKCLGKSLGDVLTGFLGPGDWRPNRKAIAEIWAQRKKQRSNDVNNCYGPE